MKHFFSDYFEAYSAGSKPTALNPYVVKVMEEIGISMKDHYSKNVTDFIGENFDYVVTVCDDAKESCPFFPGAKSYVHRSFPDPSEATGTEEEILEFVRGVRDEIKNFIIEFFGPLKGEVNL